MKLKQQHIHKQEYRIHIIDKHTNLVHHVEILEKKELTQYVHNLEPHESQTYKVHTTIKIYTHTYTQNINTNKHTPQLRSRHPH